MLTLPGKKHIIVAIGGKKMRKGEFREQIAKLDGALGAKVHPDWVSWIAIAHAIDVVSEIKAKGLLCFVDRKFDEVPSEVEKNAALWQDLGVDMITAMVGGGIPMLQAAKSGGPEMILLGVTVLTTKDEKVCKRTHGRSIAETVVDFAKDAIEGNCDGTVCAPVDLYRLKDAGNDPRSAVRVIPNVRLPDASDIIGDDQNKDRQATPSLVGELCGDKGAVVMGRPIVNADDSALALQQAEENYQLGMKVHCL